MNENEKSSYEIMRKRKLRTEVTKKTDQNTQTLKKLVIINKMEL